MEGDQESAPGALTTEGVNRKSVNLDRLSGGEIARLMNREDRGVARAVGREVAVIGQAIESIAARLGGGGRLIYLGAGTSGRLGVLDASECPPTFNVPPGMVVGVIAGGTRALTNAVEEIEDCLDEGRADVERLEVGSDDVVVGLSTSGRTPYVLGALRAAREGGALTVAITCNRSVPVEREADIVIAPVVGPEVVSGSTRLKAGTAQKMVLNMLSTGAMVLLGKTYGNLMVDLRPTNTKLRARAVRIVATVTGLNEEAAQQVLAEAGDVKTAIVCVLAGVTPDDARTRLAAAGGVVRVALESAQ